MGRPKAELLLESVPVLQFLLKQWKWPGPTMLVTAADRAHPPGADLFHVEHSDSPTPAYPAGPLRGIFTALSHAATPIVVLTTVDMPAVRRPQLNWLVARLQAKSSWHGVMTTVSRENLTEVEPFPFACRTAALPVIAERLASGRQSVIGLQDEPGFALLPAPSDWPPDTWTNLNSPDDYAAFVASLGATTV